MVLYYKVTNENECHHDFQYQDGLNVDTIPFSETGDCVPGGLYFTDIEHISQFFNYGFYIREITLPESDKDLKIVKIEIENEPVKWRANKIILGKRWTLESFIEEKFQDRVGRAIAGLGFMGDPGWCEKT